MQHNQNIDGNVIDLISYKSRKEEEKQQRLLNSRRGPIDSQYTLDNSLVQRDRPNINLRLKRIKISLERINTLMLELRKLSTKKEETTDSRSRFH